MLREYQDEIKRLKDQLDATQRGVIIGEDGKVIKDKFLPPPTFCNIFNYTVLYCTELNCTELYCTILYYTILFSALLYCAVLD